MTQQQNRFRDLLEEAAAQHRAVGAFNVILLEHAEAITRGAEQVGLPVILQISENCIRYHGSMEPIVQASLSVARLSDVPVLVHLDHITDLELVRAGIDLGVDSIMFDGSQLPYAQNVATTASVVSLCHTAGIGVEAELGEVGGKDGVHAPGARTRPDEAVRFVRDSGVDALAVAVGTSHAMQTRTAAVDHELVAALRDVVPVPLVLHGSSGLPDEELRRAVTDGMAKVNISTHLNGLFTQAVREQLSESADLVDPRRYVAAGRGAIVQETARLLDLLGAVPARR